MPLYRIAHESRRPLLRLPETGMGFQLVLASEGPKRPTYWLIFAAARALRVGLSDPDEPELRSRFVRGELDDLFSSTSLRTIELRDYRELLRRTEPGTFDEALAVQERAKPAPSALIKRTKTEEGQKFYRFSSRVDDARVNGGTGNWLPGTYGAPASDLPLAPSGFAAVGRYALPYSEPASFVHVLCPKPGTSIHIGTVAPAFGQAGGGVEVYFPDGAEHVGDGPLCLELPDA